MMVDYSINHTGDVYEMWNPTTNRIHTTRNVIWLRRMFYEQPQHVWPKISITPADDLYIEYAADVRAWESETQERAEAPRQTRTVTREAQATEDEDDNQARPIDEDYYDIQTEVIDNSTPQVTRAGRATKPPARLIKTIDLAQAQELNAEAAEFEIALTAAEAKYYDAMRELGELALVGAAGGNYVTTEQLKPMKYDEAMATPDAANWEKAIIEEHNRMKANTVWEVQKEKDVPKDATIMTSTWAMKRKANGTLRARMNAQGFEQINGEHYEEDDKAAPVVNDITIRIAMCLMVMAAWMAHIMDVHGAFLKREIQSRVLEEWEIREN
jgi:hypothetical protein